MYFHYRGNLDSFYLFKTFIRVEQEFTLSLSERSTRTISRVGVIAIASSQFSFVLSEISLRQISEMENRETNIKSYFYAARPGFVTDVHILRETVSGVSQTFQFVSSGGRTT